MLLCRTVLFAKGHQIQIEYKKIVVSMISISISTIQIIWRNVVVPHRPLRKRLDDLYHLQKKNLLYRTVCKRPANLDDPDHLQTCCPSALPSLQKAALVRLFAKKIIVSVVPIRYTLYARGRAVFFAKGFH